jgi:hypothetical protein
MKHARFNEAWEKAAQGGSSPRFAGADPPSS